MVVGLAATQMSFGFAIEQCVEIGMGREIDVGLHVAEAGERTGRDPCGPGRDLGLELIVRDHAIDQTDAMRLRGVDLVAQEQQLLGFGRSGVVSEQPGGSEIAAESNLRVSRSEFGLVRRDSQIAGQAHAKSRAHGEAIHGSDGDFRDVVEEPGKVVPGA